MAWVLKGVEELTFIAGIWTWIPKKLKKKTFTRGEFDPRTFRVQKQYPITELQRIIHRVVSLRISDVIECKMVFQSANPNLGIRFNIFLFFSKIPRRIWKISFYMSFNMYILPKIHCRSLLNFFLIQNPTLNCVWSKDSRIISIF